MMKQFLHALDCRKHLSHSLRPERWRDKLDRRLTRRPLAQAQRKHMSATQSAATALCVCVWSSLLILICWPTTFHLSCVRLYSHPTCCCQPPPMASATSCAALSGHSRIAYPVLASASSHSIKCKDLHVCPPTAHTAPTRPSIIDANLSICCFCLPLTKANGQGQDGQAIYCSCNCVAGQQCTRPLGRTRITNRTRGFD